MIKWILTKIVGTKNQREVRRLRPIVEQIVSIEESWNGKGQEFLLEKTREWQGYLHRFLPMDLPPVRIVEAAPREELEEIAAKLNARFESLKSEFASLPAVEATPASIEEGKAAWNNITPQFDKLRERYLNQILPEAFAAVKHGARLLCGEERDICGQKQVWDMVHFDVQLLGGIALHRGYIAEMATGEGKTLVATLPVYLNALTGMGVHVVTVNDYLARRDSEWMGMLFQFLGLTVGCIQSMMPSQLRREQYACDITYGTNAEFGFDYLRDNGMATSKSEQVQRGHYFSIVDEVDSILIDEARTPLIISGPAVVTREQQYDTLRPAIERVVKAQTDLCNELMAQALKICQGRLCAATLDQLGAAALYGVGSDYFSAVREEYHRRRDTCMEGLSQIPGVVCECPKGAFYLMAKLPVDDTDKFQTWLLEEFQDNGETVMFAPGEGFYGTPGKGRDEVRLAYILKQADLRRAMEVLAHGIEAYNSRKL